MSELVFGSVCSGIEAASAVAGPRCAKCGGHRAVDKLKRDKQRKHGHADWCSKCYARHAWKIRNSRVSKERKRQWNLSARYKIRAETVEAMRIAQDGRCAICQGELREYHIDHCHATGRVRGLLCSFCNRSLRLVEQPELLAAALKYLGRSL